MKVHKITFPKPADHISGNLFICRPVSMLTQADRCCQWLTEGERKHNVASLRWRSYSAKALLFDGSAVGVICITGPASGLVQLHTPLVYVDVRSQIHVRVLHLILAIDQPVEPVGIELAKRTTQP